MWKCSLRLWPQVRDRQYRQMACCWSQIIVKTKTCRRAELCRASRGAAGGCWAESEHNPITQLLLPSICWSCTAAEALMPLGSLSFKSPGSVAQEETICRDFGGWKGDMATFKISVPDCVSTRAFLVVWIDFSWLPSLWGHSDQSEWVAHCWCVIF